MTDYVTPTTAALIMGYSEMSLRKCHRALPVPPPVKIDNRLMWRRDECEKFRDREVVIKRGRKPGSQSTSSTPKPVASFNNQMAVDFISGKYAGPTQRARYDFRKLVSRHTKPVTRRVTPPVDWCL